MTAHRFIVELTEDDLRDSLDLWRESSHEFWRWIDVVAKQIRAQRPFKVGDTVVYDRHRQRGVIIAIDDDEAWVRWASGVRSVWHLSSLCRVEPGEQP